jgi:glutamate---cysteine ligase / carboxylate-amine ligase
VWWDVRPHPNFGTVELRMCDAMASMDEIAGVAALAQSLVTALDRRIDEGRPLPGARDWVVRENKWLAARHGLDASIIVDDQGTLAPVRDVIGAMLEDLEPFAAELGCVDELVSVQQILGDGPGYVRQRRVVDEGGSLIDVVDDMIEQLGSGVRAP